MEDFMVPVIYDHPDGLFTSINQGFRWYLQTYGSPDTTSTGDMSDKAARLKTLTRHVKAARRHGHVGPPVDDFQCECWCIFNSTLVVYQGYHGKCLLVFKPQVTSSLEVA